MGNFFAELRRRHIYRVGAGYVVVAWVLTQVVEAIAQIYAPPAWIPQAIVAVLAIGFPVALAVAWMIEGKAHEAVASAVRSNNTTVDWVLAGGLLLVLGVLGYQQLAPETTLIQPAGIDAARSASLNPGSAISLAVLPFTNLSSDPEQEFFSDGITEEITSALAKIPNLQVVGRTSAFQFKGENRDLTAIGRALHATHLIEGSVRKDGNEVRITAQLIRADNGTHLWTESYNRELRGIFAIQEEIATAIASSLQVPLGLKEGQSLVANRTSDTDSYQEYLRARALVRARGPQEPGGPLTEAVKLLEQVVERDPNYAPAWGLLGQAYALTTAFSALVAGGSVDELRRVAGDALQKAEADAQQAIHLDPDNIDGYAALGLMRNFRGEFVPAEDLYKQALSLDPGNSETLNYYGFMLGSVGRLRDSLALRLRLQAQEPFVPVFNAFTAQVLSENGRTDEAIEILKSLPTPSSRFRLAQVYASSGRYGEAADALQDLSSGLDRPGILILEEAIRLLRAAPAQVASPQTIVSSGPLGFVYLYTGAPNRVLDYYENLADAGYPALGNVPSTLWTSSYAPVRKTERFKAYAQKAGLINYWRERGWPDLCRPTTGDDFECD